MIKKLIKNTDFILLAVVLILFIIGVFAIYSANYNSDSGNTEYLKQIAWFAVGTVICLAIWLIDHNNIGKLAFLAAPLFVISLIALFFTPQIANVHSWYKIGGLLFQPSEPFKIIYILVMGRVIEYVSQKHSKGINRFSNLLVVLAIMGFVFMLIAMQPDFGTAAVYVIITMFMLFRVGLDYKYLLVAFLILAITIPIIYFGVLSDSQRNRIKVFLDPSLDPLGNGYHASQSKIAVGSGMLTGTGYLKGTQTQYGFLPVKSSDFIFSVIAEELGFVGAGSVIILFGVLLIKIVYIAMTANDYYGSIIVIGIFGMFFSHYIENIGMTMGLTPITGIPLPFVSYGGSSMLTNMVSLGLILSVGARSDRR